MKSVVYMLVCAGAIFFAACSSQTGNEKKETLTLMKEAEKAAGKPQRMQVSDIKETITYKGKEYHSSILRRPDESLPVVTNEEGDKFVDNRITLRLTCSGKQLIERSFTKESFASVVDARFIKYAILEGIVFNKTTPQGIVYAASVGYPESDLYQPIRLTVTTDGKLSIAKEEVLEEDLPEEETKTEN